MRHLALVLLALCLIPLSPTRADPLPEESWDFYRQTLHVHELLKGGQVTPNWIEGDDGGDRFWFEDRDAFYEVDPTANTLRTLESKPEEKNSPRVVRPNAFPGFPPVLELHSPDGRWAVTEKEHNLWLRDLSAKETESLSPLTTDGTAQFEWLLTQDDQWSAARWSPDSRHVAVMKEDREGVASLPVVDWLSKNETVVWRPNTRTGERLVRTEVYLLDIEERKAVRAQIPSEDTYVYYPAWLPDSSALLVLQASRDFKSLRVLAIDPTTGAARPVLEERSDTFIKTLGINPSWTELLTLLPDGERFLWQSERDGWDHLYLYDLKGKLLRRLTEGEFPVLRVREVAGEWVYFEAHADPARPYDTHLYRMRLDGTGFTRLTEAPGQHRVTFSPSKNFFVDTHQSLDRPPATELRRADGTLVRTLSTPDPESVAAVERLRPHPPEPFVVKAADGKTDLHGVLFKPYNFDPARKYPVVEHIYAGPFTLLHQRTYVAIQWRGGYAQALAHLGFITVIVDGRGTPERGKAFQDVVYSNFGRNEIPDHAATLRQLAAARPYMDLERVGIFGGSWGGYFTVRALLLAPELYKVGVATSPLYDLYDHGATGLEGYMPLLKDAPEAYEYASSLRLADQLQGKLLMIHGTSDINATLSATMKMVRALMEANKPYDLILLPGEAHHHPGKAGEYRMEAHARYFVQHLIGAELPER